MKNKIFSLFLLFALTVPYRTFADDKLPSFAPSNTKSDLSGTVPGEIIVKYKTDKVNLGKKTGKTLAGQVESQIGVTEQDEIKDLNMHVVKTDQNVNDTIKQFEKDPNVEFAQPNYKKFLLATPNDTYFSIFQWALKNTGQNINTVTGTAGDDIKAYTAWDGETSSQSDVVVADIDTGARYTHEDLANNMWNGSTCVSDTNTTIVGGCPNHGWNYADGNNNPMDTDASGHGTMVGSVMITQTNNAKGISGMSYYNHIKLMAVKFGMDSASEIKAINFAKYNGVKIINASFGGTDYDPAEKAAIDAFPGLVVAAAGNGDVNGNGVNNDITPIYPASYASSNIISVAATDQNDALGIFSNYGASSVHMGAPGVNITVAYNSTDSSYAIAEGTSFAAPHVSGAAAMLLSKFPTMTTDQIKNQLLSSGDSIASLAGKTTTGKRLNLANALQNPSLITPTYRFRNLKDGQYLLTTSEVEKSSILANYKSTWTLESSGFNVYSSSQPGLTAVSRFRNLTNGRYLYTASDAEKSSLNQNYKSTWVQEDDAFYVYLTQQPNTTPVFRFRNMIDGRYLYTASTVERNSILQNYKTTWVQEDNAFYIPN